MPPYAPAVLRRKYGGRYQSYGRRSKSVARSMATSISRRVGVWPRYSLPSRTVELKCYDTNWSFNIVGAGHVFCLNTITQGTDDFNRIGKSIQLKNLSINYYITSIGVGPNLVCRTLFVLDRQTNGATPAVSDIIESNAVEALYKESQRTRFKILYDKVTFAGADGSGINVIMQGGTNMNVAVPLNYKQEFLSNAGTVAAINKGAIWCLIVTNVTSNLRTNGAARVQYTDV